MPPSSVTSEKSETPVYSVLDGQLVITRNLVKVSRRSPAAEQGGDVNTGNITLSKAWGEPPRARVNAGSL